MPETQACFYIVNLCCINSLKNHMILLVDGEKNQHNLMFSSEENAHYQGIKGSFAY